VNLIVSYGNGGNKLFVFVFVFVFENMKTHLGDLSVVLVAQAPVLVKGGSRLNKECHEIFMFFFTSAQLKFEPC
jgi:hypothetical protein